MIIEPSVSMDEKIGSASASHLVSFCSQVQIKIEDNRVLLILPTAEEQSLDLPWSEIWQEIKHLLKQREKSWPANTAVCLVVGDRLLDNRQLQSVEEVLTEAKLCLSSIRTSRRQTAVVAATSGYSVEQNLRTNNLSLFDASPPSTDPVEMMAEPLYLKNTVRSGLEVRHPGTIIIFGDVNPGGTIIAAGDVFVWGRLRGMAHAGARGNQMSQIMALQMEFTQLRIANSVARPPQKLPHNFVPEIAFMSKTGINLARANDFTKTHSFSLSEDCWVKKN